jgi:hypothetical protein
MTMKPPRDGWDGDEREAIGALAPLFEDVQRHHAGDLLSADDRQRLLRRIQRNTRQSWSPSTWLGTSWPQVLAAAAAIVVVAGGWIVWRSTRPSPSAPPPKTVATQPAAPTYVLALNHPVIRVSPAALTYRGSGASSLLADLKPAFDALRRDDYATVARELTPLVDRYPAAVEVPYYQGVAQLFLGNPAAALDRFAEAERRADATFAADILWYQAIASERAGDLDATRRRLHTLCVGQTARSTDACAAEHKLQ